MGVTYELGACPVCRTGRGEQIASREDMRREIEELWSFHLPRLHEPPAPEQLRDRLAFSQDPPLRLARCPGCRTLYRNPHERPVELVDTYAGDDAPPDALSGLFDNQHESYRAQARRLTRIRGRRGTGIEVGSYVGAFLAAARDEGWDFRGVDVNDAAIAFARERGFDAAHGTLEDHLPASPVDAVAIWNCFDQLPDPRGTLRAARRCLAPGGVLALRVPNGAFYALLRPYLTGALGGAARSLLAQNNLLGFPYRYGFTPASLRRLASEEGFRPLRVVGDTLVPLADRATRRWAAAEERLLKAVLRAAGRVGLPTPWFELYARTNAARPGASAPGLEIGRKSTP